MTERGNEFDTCCKSCAMTQGLQLVHDKECISRNSHIGFYCIKFEPSLQLKDVICKYKSMILGRSGTKCSQDLSPHFIGLGADKRISRKYAKIEWNESKKCFEVIVLSQKGIYSHSKVYEEDDIISLAMTKPTPLEMNGVKLFFM